MVLEVVAGGKRRLRKGCNRKAKVDQGVGRLTLAGRQNRSEYQGVLAALANANPKAAQALVTDLLSIAGKSAVGGRSIRGIADRFLKAAQTGPSSPLPAETGAPVRRVPPVSR